MKNFLFIYNLVPEDLRLYSVPFDHPLIESIKFSNGVVINGEELTEEQEKNSTAVVKALGEWGPEHISPYEDLRDFLIPYPYNNVFTKQFYGVSVLTFIL